MMTADRLFSRWVFCLKTIEICIYDSTAPPPAVRPSHKLNGNNFLLVLQGIRWKITTTSYSIYAIAAEGYDFCARGQQNESGWFGEFWKDAHDGTNYANYSVLSIKAFGWVFTAMCIPLLFCIHLISIDFKASRAFAHTRIKHWNAYIAKSNDFSLYLFIFRKVNRRTFANDFTSFTLKALVIAMIQSIENYYLQYWIRRRRRVRVIFVRTLAVSVWLKTKDNWQ